MNVLTTMQVNLIRGDLRREGIEMNELEDDLLDHICCVLEEEMHNYESFEIAYEHVKREFCPDGYREIQVTTTNLLTNKYLKMKTASNVIGITGAASVLIGTGFKFAHWPFANILIVFGVGTLAFLYLPILLALSLKQTDRTLSKVRNAVGYLSGSILLVGTLFKFMHWPGATIVAIAALAAFCLIYLPLFIGTSAKGVQLKVSPIAVSVLIVVSASVLFAIVNPRGSSAYHRSVEALSLNLDETFMTSHDRLLEVRKTDLAEAKALSQETDDLVEYVTQFKNDLLEILASKNGQVPSHLPENKTMVFHEKTTNPMFASNKDHLRNGVDLKKKVEKFRSSLIASNSKATSVAPILNTNDGNWIEKNFLDKPLFVIFNNLTLIQLEATNLELAAIKAS